MGAKIIDRLVEKESANYLRNYILDNIESLDREPLELDYSGVKDVKNLILRNASFLNAYAKKSDICDLLNKF